MKTLAHITGTMLRPGVSKNRRLYTRENIGRAVARMQARLADPDALPVVMRTHHDAGDDSRLIVGRLTGIAQQPDGSATYEADLYDTAAGRDIGTLIDPDAPALRSTSIHGYWVGDPVKVSVDGVGLVDTAPDLEVNAMDFTGTPGVTGAVIRSVAFESHQAPAGGAMIVESGEATVTPVVEVADRRNPVLDRYSPAQREAMAAKGQAMPDGTYAIASKTDLRGYLRTVTESTPAAVLRHIAARADALGLAGMIPAGFAPEPATVDTPVGEAYVTVTVCDDQGNPLVVVATNNVDADLVVSAAKKAAKLAARALDNAPDDDGDDTGDIAVQVVPDDNDAAYLGGESHTEAAMAENWKITVGGADLPPERVAEIVAAVERAPAPKTPTAEAVATAPTTEEVAVSDTTAVVEQAAPITEATAALISRTVTETVTATIAALGKAKADKKAAKATKTPSDQGAAVESETKTGEKALKESTTKEGPRTVTADELAKLLDEREAKTIDRVRETLLKEGGIPTRKGFGVTETDASPLTGDELWEKRSQVWSSVFPAQYAPAQPEPVAAAAQ